MAQKVLSLTTLLAVALLGIVILRFQKATVSGIEGRGSVSVAFQHVLWGWPLKFVSKEEKWSNSEIVYSENRFAVSRLMYDITFLDVMMFMAAVTVIELQLIELLMRMSVVDLFIAITSLCLMFGVYYTILFTADTLPTLVDSSDQYSQAEYYLLTHCDTALFAMR